MNQNRIALCIAMLYYSHLNVPYFILIGLQHSKPAIFDQWNCFKILSKHDLSPFLVCLIFRQSKSLLELLFCAELIHHNDTEIDLSGRESINKDLFVAWGIDNFERKASRSDIFDVFIALLDLSSE